MSFIPKNPLIMPEVQSSSSTPPAGTRGLFAGKDGWYDIDSDNNVTKIAGSSEGSSGGAQSSTFYIGASDSLNNDGLDYICSNTAGNRFNEIIDKIMSKIETNALLSGSKIVIRKGTYYQNGVINITQRCIMDFEGEFDTASEGTYDWIVTANNCIFSNFKSYGLFYLYGSSNTFNNCWFVKNLNIGATAVDSYSNRGDDNKFYFCTFAKNVQVGDSTAEYESFINGKRNSFIGCRFNGGELNLTGEESIVKDCHFANGEYGIRYNGNFPDIFTAHLYSNSLFNDEWSYTNLYDSVTIKFADQLPMVSVDEFNTLTKNGMYLVYESTLLFLGIIHTDQNRCYTIINPFNFCILTRTTHIGDNSLIEDYTNKFCAYGDIDGNSISETYQTKKSNSLITNSKDVVSAINEVAAKCIQSVTIKGGNNNWIQEAVLDSSGNTIGYRYGQVVSVTNATITPNSKIDMQLSSEQAVIFQNKSLAFVTENDDGNVTVYCVGGIPQEDYTIQVTVTEVIL